MAGFLDVLFKKQPSRIPMPVPRPHDPDTILGRENLFGIDPETDADRLVRRPQAYDAEGEIVGDPGQMNPWGTGPGGTDYGPQAGGLNWRNIAGSASDIAGFQVSPSPQPTGGNFFDRFDPPRSGARRNAFDAIAPDIAQPAGIAPQPKTNAFDAIAPDLPPQGSSIRAMTPEEMKAMQPPVAGGNFFDRFDPPTPGKAETGAARGTSIMDKIDAAVRGAADTATFGMADRIASGLGALTGVGGTAGDYSANLAGQRALDQFDVTNNAAPRIAGQLAGGLAVPGGIAAGGATLPARIGRGALAGAGQGALYGAGSSEDLTDLPDVAKNAATGAAVGSAIGGAAPPLVEGAIGAGRLAGNLTGITPMLRGALSTEGSAAARVGQALALDTAAGGQALDKAAMMAAQQRGQPAIIADIGGQATQALARSAANTSPEARQALQTATDARFESQAPRIAEFVSDLGGGSDATATIERLQAAARAANRPAYAKAYAEGANGVWNDHLASLMQAPAVQDAVRGAVKTGANRAVAEGFRPVKSPFDVAADGTIAPAIKPDGSAAIPSLQFWDHVKRNLDDTVGRFQRTGEKSAAADAAALRTNLVNTLDRAVPSYAVARRTAAEAFGAQDAVEAGAKFVSDRRPIAEARRDIAAMSAPERQLFAHGFASALADKVEKVGARRSVLTSIYQSPSARERVAMAMGPEKDAKLKNYLNVEAAMDAVRKAVQGNSTTARQLFEHGMAGGMSTAAGAGLGYWQGGTLTSAGAGAILFRLARGKIDQNVARRVGEMLASSDPGVYKKAFEMVAKSKRISDFIQSIAPRTVSAILPVILNEQRSKSLPRTNPSARHLQPMTQ